MKTILQIYIVDAFTDETFKGNPAGVCMLEHKLSNEQMLAIAKELGLSETAFVTKLENQEVYAIRYFSPVMEIPLCGHATLASSKVLFEIHPEITDIHFKNIQNLDLFIKKYGEEIEMEFPIYDTVPQEVPVKLLDALGIEKITNSAFNKETNILLIEIESSERLQQLTPDFEKLKHSHDAINGVLITAVSKKADFDFESRYFWPWSGTNEDPVTGGTHTFLAKYWSDRIQKKKMRSFQCSERSGFMEVELINDTKMTLKSQAQIVLKGELRL